MGFVNVHITYKGKTYEAELDDEVEPADLARMFAEDINAMPSDNKKAEFRFAILKGRGIAEGSHLELEQLPGRRPVHVKNLPSDQQR